MSKNKHEDLTVPLYKTKSIMSLTSIIMELYVIDGFHRSAALFEL
ncbi:hypothetical protein ACTHO0_13440 [Cytobacillus praedii]